MTYSACGFTDDVLRCIGDSVSLPGGIEETADLGEKADAAISAITGLAAKARAACFVSEVLSGVESLGALREAVGTHALDYTLYLADAIATGGILELPPHRRDYAAFVEGLPGASRWRLHIRFALP